jgi:hypothetical protein
MHEEPHPPNLFEDVRGYPVAVWDDRKHWYATPKEEVDVG